MAAVSATIAAVALAATAASSYTSYKAGKEAAEDQEEQQRISSNQAKAEQANQRRQSIREERVRRAQISQGAENSGVGASSGKVGSIGALGSITGGNVASSFQATRTTDRLFSLSQDISDSYQKQAAAQAVGQVSGAVFQSAGGFSAFSGAPAGAAPPTNAQGQSTPLFDNPAFVRNY